MRKLCWVGLLALVFACVPWASNVDGKRFPCQVSDDCAGDGFVCIAGICRDPRDLALPDGGAADGSHDSGDIDRDAATDASHDSAAPDHDVGRDGGSDASVVDHRMPDAVVADADRADTVVADATVADAPADAGSDAGCVSDNECPTGDAGPGICFSGRCGHFAITNLPVLNDQVRGISIALNRQGLPAIGYYSSSNSVPANCKAAYQASDGSAWHAVDNVDTGNVGAEPQLVWGPGDRPWLAYRDDANDTVRVAHYEGLAFTSESIGSYGLAPDDRSGFAIEPTTGVQHFLVRDPGAGLLYSARSPGTDPSAVPTDLLVWRGTFYDTNARWPALFRDPVSGMIYGTFAARGRPYIGLVMPGIGFVSVQLAPETNAGCGQLGLNSGQACSAFRPIDLAFDSRGQVHLCTHIDDQNGNARVVYIVDDGNEFQGRVVSTESDDPSGYYPGFGCAIVVDQRDIPHVFYSNTTHKRLRHVVVLPAQIVNGIDVEAVDDTGQWPDAVVAADGTLHLAYAKVTARLSYPTTSTLMTAKLVWGP